MVGDERIVGRARSTAQPAGRLLGQHLLANAAMVSTQPPLGTRASCSFSLTTAGSAEATAGVQLAAGAEVGERAHFPFRAAACTALTCACEAATAALTVRTGACWKTCCRGWRSVLGTRPGGRLLVAMVHPLLPLDHVDHRNRQDPELREGHDHFGVTREAFAPLNRAAH